MNTDIKNITKNIEVRSLQLFEVLWLQKLTLLSASTSKSTIMSQ